MAADPRDRSPERAIPRDRWEESAEAEAEQEALAERPGSVSSGRSDALRGANGEEEARALRAQGERIEDQAAVGRRRPRTR